VSGISAHGVSVSGVSDATGVPDLEALLELLRARCFPEAGGTDLERVAAGSSCCALAAVCEPPEVLMTAPAASLAELMENEDIRPPDRPVVAPDPVEFRLTSGRSSG
jgi:hypothetical protein